MAGGLGYGRALRMAAALLRAQRMAGALLHMSVGSVTHIFGPDARYFWLSVTIDTGVLELKSCVATVAVLGFRGATSCKDCCGTAVMRVFIWSLAAPYFSPSNVQSR